jgi:V/A-type H+-transporting ATPase subunit E
MTDKLERLTKQIYEEGVGKAKAEAKKIIEAAEEEKKKVLRSAREEAKDIQDGARKEAEELKNRVTSELRMATQQTLALLRQQITELICVKVAKSSTGGVIDDPKFLKKILEMVIKEWISTSCKQGEEFQLRLPQNMQKDIQDYFFEKGKQELDKGITVQFDEKIKGGFIVSPKDGSYRIGFTEEDFKELILYFLRPRMKEFLFHQNNNNE